MKKISIKRYAGITIALFGAAALSLLLFFALFRIDAIHKTLSHICRTLMPFIIGSVIAYVICPLCNKFDKLYAKVFSFIKKEKSRKSIINNMSVFTGLLIAVLFIYFMIIVIIPNLVNSVIKLIHIIPDNIEKLVSFVQKFMNENETLMQYSETIIDKTYSYINDWLNNDFLGYAQGIATGVSTGVVNILVIVFNIIIGFIVAAYLLTARKRLAKQGQMLVYSIFKKEHADSVMEEIKYTDRVFSGFINGKLVDALVIALISYLGLKIFTICNPGKEVMSEILIAFIVGIFNVIPFFGWYIAWFIGALLCLIINPAQCLFFVIFNFILQQIDGNIIGPKILGNTTGISSFWVLFAILLFGDIWGFAGMLLGVPIFAVIYHLIKKWVFKRLKINGMEQLSEEYETEFPPNDREKKLENM
ncbi:MAG: AI-2E family transporter [Clostridia bacterium]|nr:AI-2E family transporter [Clostridia bacterium]